MGDDVFQVSELVDPYRFAPSIDLEENWNFSRHREYFCWCWRWGVECYLSSSGQAQVNENDGSNEINVEDCDEANDESIEEEEDNFD